MVDNSADLPQEYVKKHELKRISIPYHLNDVTHYDDNGEWKNISAKEYYDALRSGGTSGTTLINPDSFEKIFTDYAKRGEPLLAIVLSSGLSGTAQNAVTALDDVKETYPDCEIYTFDALSAASGTTLAAVIAVAKRAEGLSAKETSEYLNKRVQNYFTLFTVDDLNFLHRGGRLSKFSAVAGSLIGIKPLLNVSPDGKLQLKDKVRGRRASLETLAAQVKRSLEPDTKLKFLTISHGDCKEDAEKLADKIKALVDVEEVYIEMMSPVIGAHTGPGGLALAFDADMDRASYEAKFYPEK